MVWALFGKEIRELARDRRVMVSAIVLPIVLIGLFVYLFAGLQASLQKPKPQTVAVVGPSDHPLRRALSESRILSLAPAPSAEKAREWVRAGKAKAAVSLRPFDPEELRRGQKWRIEVWVDSDDPMAPLVARSVRELAERLNLAMASAAFRSAGLDANVLQAIVVDERPVDPGKGLGESMLLSILPYLVVIWAFYGGMSVAADVVAGEKERQTLETLLVSPATRRDIALAKFLALSVVCLAGSASTLLGVGLLALVPLPGGREALPGGAGLTVAGGLAILTVVAPLALAFAAVLLALSTLARNVREAQTHLTLASFMVLAPAIYSQFIGFTGNEGEGWVRWVPILNAAVCVRQTLLGRLDGSLFAATLLVSLLLAALGVAAAVRLMRREAILRRL
ncbi:MAG: ABC transporter permease subunit [Fimbriimonadales bacterium]|nr:ABC transporter permease subunit [Fimbriimonadales bacterium]